MDGSEISIFTTMGKILSYLYPITKRVHSEVNGILEVTWYNGKKQLNSENANYSYGSLQKILKFGLDKINVDKVKTVLLLGLGGGSVIETLRIDFNFSKSITAVDIDPIIIDIAKSEFNISEDENLKLVCEDALTFMTRNALKYDLIIIDLFIDIEVPKTFFKLSFWQQVINATSPNGTLIFNASLEKSKSKELIEVIDFLKTHMYQTQVYEQVNNTNTLIIASGL